MGGRRRWRTATIGLVGALGLAACSGTAVRPEVAATPGTSTEAAASPTTGVLTVDDVLARGETTLPEPAEEGDAIPAPEEAPSSTSSSTSLPAGVEMNTDTQCPGLDVIGWFDADGDGVHERIVPTGGNTGRLAWIFDDTCSPLPGPGAPLFEGFFIGGSGGSCAPTGCHVAAACDPTAGQLTVRIVSPFERTFEVLPEEEVRLVDVRVETQTWSLVDGAFQMVETSEETAPYGEVDVSMPQAEEALIGCDR